MSNSYDENAVLEPAGEDDPFAEESPYAILGLDRNADLSKVKSALRVARKRAERSGGNWRKAEAAADALSDPRRRLAIDLFAVHETMLHREIVRRYADVQFELVPDDIVPLMMQASDLAWGDPVDDFTVPAVPKVIFESMMPPPPREDELVVPDRKK